MLHRVHRVHWFIPFVHIFPRQRVCVEAPAPAPTAAPVPTGPTGPTGPTTEVTGLQICGDVGMLDCAGEISAYIPFRVSGVSTE